MELGPNSTPEAPGGTPAPANDNHSPAEIPGLDELKSKLGIKDPEPAPEPKPQTPPVDASTAANYAHLAKVDRQLKAERARLDAEKAEIARSREADSRLTKAQESWKTPGQKVAALREVFGDLTEEAFYEMGAALGTAPAALTPEDIDKLVGERIAKLKEDERLAAEAEQAKVTERRSQTELQIIGNVGQYLADHAETYPAVMHRGVTAERIRDLMKEGVKATGAIPSDDVILGFLEEEYRAETLALPFIPKTETPARPMRTFGAADKRGAALSPSNAEAPPKRMSLAEQRARFIAEKVAPLDRR